MRSKLSPIKHLRIKLFLIPQFCGFITLSPFIASELFFYSKGHTPHPCECNYPPRLAPSFGMKVMAQCTKAAVAE
jgi:hypothetical protein